MQQSTAVVPYNGNEGERYENSTGSDLGRKRRLFRAFEANKSREQEEQKESRRYYSGRQLTDKQLKVYQKRNQPPIWDNRIARKVDFLVGVEQRMRRDPKAFARGPEDQKAADTATASLRFVCDQARWETIASDVAHDGMVSGVGVAWIGIENGKRGLDVKAKRGQVDRFFYDPRTALPDFSDARYMGMHLWQDIEDIKAEYPQHAEMLDAMVDRENGVTLTILDEERDEQWGDFEHRRVRVVEMYERKMTPQGAVWYFCKFTGTLELESGVSPYLDEYGQPDCPYVAWSPYIDERGDRYGVVRNMRPMQDEVNQRRSKALHMMGSRRLHMRKGVVDDVDKARTEIMKADGVVEHNGTWGEDVGIIDDNQDIRWQVEMLAQAQSSLENLGPNPGLIGKGGGVADQSGRAILAQRDSGMTELSPVFERLRDWKLRCYRKMWARVRQAWTGERYIRITEDPKSPTYLGINQPAMDPMTGGPAVDPMTGQPVLENALAEIDVDVILDEGPDTIVMQEELLQTLSQLGEAAVGPMGRVMIELSQVANKEALLAIMDKATQPPPEVAELNKRMQQLEEAMKQALLAKAHADTEAVRVDSAVKLATAMVPPQVVPQVFPMPFADQQGMGAQPPQQMPQLDQMMPEGPPPDQQMMDSGVPQDMPMDQMPGGLPIDGELGSPMSAGFQGA